MRNPFPSFIKRYGKDAVIVYRTPQLTDTGEIARTKKNHPIFDSVDIPVRCRLKFTGTSKYLDNSTSMKKYDAKGLFLLTDEQYLNSDSLLYIDGLYYKMQPPMYKKTHIEVYLKSKDLD